MTTDPTPDQIELVTQVLRFLPPGEIEALIRYQPPPVMVRLKKAGRVELDGEGRDYTTAEVFTDDDPRVIANPDLFKLAPDA